MNILPKKNWHVLRRENIKKVKEDEKKAEEEERRRIERIHKAEHEIKLEELRKKREEPGSSNTSVPRIKHLNLFEEEEIEGSRERNYEYEKEKKEKIDKLESQLGIKKMFAEGTNELNKKKSWYEKKPIRHYDDFNDSSTEGQKQSWRDMLKERCDKDVEAFKEALMDEIKIQRKKEKRDKKKSRKDKDLFKKKDKKEILKKLREERINREKEEKKRINVLFGIKDEIEKEDEIDKKSDKPIYNSMYHPELARKR
ncbi:Leukocyte receptor cluster member 1 [Strongyloides ratti]|uniref:Leukocyte receptor cluster member 1 n=1 Tax=Strongyloides ratti TaxID=34506 RepID=A0A090LAK8_STRRB|nr:Leukocyte receptor cluster member 1 [Strongyloides ratti]CEF64575.1 Leukocyte receptor cluster member 1 [Strongyloides ratti]